MPFCYRFRLVRVTKGNELWMWWYAEQRASSCSCLPEPLPSLLSACSLCWLLVPGVVPFSVPASGITAVVQILMLGINIASLIWYAQLRRQLRKSYDIGSTDGGAGPGAKDMPPLQHGRLRLVGDSNQESQLSSTFVRLSYSSRAWTLPLRKWDSVGVGGGSGLFVRGGGCTYAWLGHPLPLLYIRIFFCTVASLCYAVLCCFVCALPRYRYSS